MNITTTIGFILAFIVFAGGIMTATPNWMIFINAHAFLIVVGGTLAATMVSFPMKQLRKVVGLFANRILGKQGRPHIQVIAEVVKLAEGQRNDSQFLLNNLESIKTPFLKEAIQLQLDGGIADDRIDFILKKRADLHFIRYEDDANVFKTISRFPPAFGLFGAVLGMIALMTGLGSPDSVKGIGPAMAIAMVATLYGIAMANFIFIPLGENLAKLNKEDRLMRNIVLDSIKLLREKEHPLVVEEYLKSYLLTSERGNIEEEKALS